MSKTWFRISRDLMEDTKQSRLTTLEFAVLVTLTGLANHRTGSYTVNGPTLRYFLPDLGKSAAQRILESLEAKGYLYRDVKPRSPLAYRYWIEGFYVTAGKYKGLQLSLTEVFATKDTSRLMYVKRDPDSGLDSGLGTEPDTRLGTANYNKKQEVRRKKEESIKLLPDIQNGDISSVSAGCGDRMPDSANLIGRRPDGAGCGEIVPDVDLVLPSLTAVQPPETVRVPEPSPRPALALVSPQKVTPSTPVAVDIRYAGEDEGYRNSEGKPVPRYAINALVEPLNLVAKTTSKGFEFFTLDSDTPVPQETAHSVINAGYFEYATRQHAS